jgi:flagellar hook assembly protein FlgD
MYFSFDFSQLTSLASKQEWMEDLADWFGIMPTANADNNLPGLVTKLESIYPNPFNPSTTIRFQLSQAAEISLEIYNIKGQKVATLTNGHKTAGTHTAIWNGIDNSGRKASSGIYYVRLKTPKQTESRKITLIK